MWLPLPHSLHTVAGLLPFHFLAAQVTVDRDRPALPSCDRLALPTAGALDALILNRHGTYPLLRRYLRLPA